ncbi:hypothetical protein BKA67DRAFT_564130 [Truncatella angustata]|uniref:Uncharacterized protein n=1 Tax=Truncatella angustata TaxID=152316 RepID=A0A9P8ZXK6_9PEZI|nr:uncharacterized protein BKA67DRAFT_564130 [Truncatella angustata]KAH6654094.1 hypothetical protein BKA67DRAFT_564130 [Truncatella angustata]
MLLDMELTWERDMCDANFVEIIYYNRLGRPESLTQKVRYSSDDDKEQSNQGLRSVVVSMRLDSPYFADARQSEDRTVIRIVALSR